MIIPNFIYEYILSLIISHLYKNQENYINPFNNQYLVDNNEVINYSTICKNWFKIVSKILSMKLCYNNYEQLKKLIEIPIPLDNNNNNNNNFQHQSIQKYNLIPLNNSVIFFKTYDEFLKCSNDIQKYKKVFIDLPGDANILTILKSIGDGEIENKVRFSLVASKDFENYIKENNIQDLIENKTIRRIFVSKDSIENEINLSKLLEINSKIIDFLFIRYIENFGIRLNFQSKPSKSFNHKINVQNILSLDFEQSKEQTKFSDCSRNNLKQLYYENSFSELLTLKNNSSDDIDQEVIEERLQYISNILSNDPTLHSIIIYHHCDINYEHYYGIFDYSSTGMRESESNKSKYTCRCFSDTSTPTNGFKKFGWNNLSPVYKVFNSILCSNPPNLISFELNTQIQEINSYLIQGLQKNKTIKNLTLYGQSIDFVLNNILIYNEQIRNLTLVFLEKHHLQNISNLDQLDLYSISFELYNEEPLEEYLNQILNHFNNDHNNNHKKNNITIKEINLKSISYSNNIKKYQIIKNNTIINVCYNKLN